MSKLSLLAVTVFASFLVGCVATAPKKSSLEIQAVQAKNFETSKKVAFESTMSVLQDLGYIVKSASLETGFITAESPNVQDRSGRAFAAAFFGGVRIEQQTAVTATVEGVKDSLSRIRLNFVTKEKRSGAYGRQAADDTPIEDPKVYQNAFDKIGEAIFIRTSSK